MAKKKLTSSSPMYGDVDLISFQVMIDGKELEDKFPVESIEVQKGVNTISTAEIVILDGDPSEQDFELLNGKKLVPGAEIRINGGYHQDNETIFEGIIVKTGLRIKEKAHSAVVVECADKAIKMTLVRNSAYFLKTKDSQVIQQLINGHSGLTADVSATSYQHDEIIQYHSTDWDFVVTRAELNGLVVVTDDNKVKVKEPEVSGSTKLSLTYGLDIIKTNLAVDSKEQLSAVECNAWDMSSQKMVGGKSSEPSVNDQGKKAYKGKDLAKVISSDDYSLHITGPMETAALKNWANARLLKSRLARIRGSLTFQGSAKIKPNELIEINGLGDFFNGSAYVSKVHHEIAEGNWITEVEVGLSPDWFVESKPDVMVPSAGGLLPGIDGLFNGIVKKIHQDPDGETRVQVDVPVIDPSGDGVWARLANLYASKDVGSFWMPEVGDEVVLGFLNNDPRFPIIIGSLYSKKNPPPYAPDQQNTVKAFVTKNKLKLIFEDQKKNIILETPGGNTVTISDQNKKITIEDSNRNKIEMSNSGITMDTMKDVKISAKGKITIDGMQGVNIKSSAGDVSGQGLNVKMKANINMSAQGTMAELKGTATTTVKGGIVMIN